MKMKSANALPVMMIINLVEEEARANVKVICKTTVKAGWCNQMQVQLSKLIPYLLVKMEQFGKSNHQLLQDVEPKTLLDRSQA